MAGFFKRASVAFLSAGLILLTTAGIYSATLPDFYSVDRGEEFVINSLFQISAKPCETNYTAAVNSQSAGVSKVTKSTLMLFGAVPIKDVESRTIDRPKLVPCGNCFGIKLITDGVMVVGLEENNDRCAAKSCGIKEGDIILSMNEQEVGSNADVARVIQESGGKPCTIKILRNSEKISVSLTPDHINGDYKAGMWVRDSSAGIGTMTFYDPQTSCFGGLGHPICDADVKEPLPLSEGKTGEIHISGFTKSESGTPGWISGDFTDDSSTGEILANSDCGIFGILRNAPEVDHEPIELGFRQEIENGKAQIYASIDNSPPKLYDITISDIDLSGENKHDFQIKVTDKELISKTGGILQGMSGSPIIQKGRLVGAVTHVLIKTPECGYAVFADEMYSQATKSLEKSIENAG